MNKKKNRKKNKRKKTREKKTEKKEEQNRRKMKGKEGPKAVPTEMVRKIDFSHAWKIVRQLRQQKSDFEHLRHEKGKH